MPVCQQHLHATSDASKLYKAWNTDNRIIVVSHISKLSKKSIQVLPNHRTFNLNYQSSSIPAVVLLLLHYNLAIAFSVWHAAFQLSSHYITLFGSILWVILATASASSSLLFPRALLKKTYRLYCSSLTVRRSPIPLHQHVVDVMMF